MAFSDYKSIAQVQKEFRIKYREENFIAAQAAPPSDAFRQELAFTLENFDVFSSEGARAEAVIFPILREVYKPHHDHYSLWIQRALTYDDKLSGTPDYLISSRSELGKTFLEPPLVVVVEAKKNDFEQGWGQCLAELIAAQKLNGDASFPVQGIVTDGGFWQFGKLVAATFSKNIDSYSVDHPAALFGALDFVFQSIPISNGKVEVT